MKYPPPADLVWPSTKEELAARSGRIYDALMFMRGPAGEVIYVGEKALHMAWHLARAGVDVHPELAVIKRWPVPGQPILVNWVPFWWPDSERPDGELITAAGPLPDPSTFDDLIDWHTQTKIEGNFS